MEVYLPSVSGSLEDLLSQNEDHYTPLLRDMKNVQINLETFHISKLEDFKS